MEGPKLTRLHALALLDYGHYHGLPEVYQQVLALVLSGKVSAENAPDEELKKVLAQIPPGELEEVLLQFLELARKRMDRVPVEIISAVELSEEQLYKLEIKLIRLLRKQLDITTTVDPSLIGGVRILVENTVIDESIKRKLQDLKQAVYKEVYLR